ncbi:zinc ABC transporter ATP-binding protein AztA [Salinibacterium sp. SYSU T00001]|uniref:zinc ABC transporter ATP-binding protein AztA n=1 Tax=Homoserinimonas sedimenticola TaxID=2986805 RepID=UPI002236BB8A|nr:zinc ABC transporter ATP-binding protein AztA [Salinibacterium sedimenticola]MCW4386298.1 zinc ABC transporter ATP-binding protein AztA [Salinibacterium sedimenticola]
MFLSAPIPSLAPELLLSLHGATAMHDEHIALDRVDLDLVAGRLTALVGPNGSGKSTLLGVLAGTHPLSHGTLNRRPGTSVAFVLQRSAVSAHLPLTVLDTVAMGRWRDRGSLGRLRRSDHEIIERSLCALDLTPLASRSLHELSGGQRQRTLVAQGLAQQADLLLLDEPAAGVDASALVLIDRAIGAELARGATVVQATHDPDAAARASTIITLADGRRL